MWTGFFILCYIFNMTVLRNVKITFPSLRFSVPPCPSSGPWRQTHSTRVQTILADDYTTTARRCGGTVSFHRSELIIVHGDPQQPWDAFASVPERNAVAKTVTSRSYGADNENPFGKRSFSRDCLHLSLLSAGTRTTMAEGPWRAKPGRQP